MIIECLSHSFHPCPPSLTFGHGICLLSPDIVKKNVVLVPLVRPLHPLLCRPDPALRDTAIAKKVCSDAGVCGVKRERQLLIWNLLGQKCQTASSSQSMLTPKALWLFFTSSVEPEMVDFLWYTVHVH